jgi:hypothetical protein
MATWADLSAYVRRTYRIADESPRMIKLVFEVNSLRSQVVMLSRVTLSDSNEEWVQIEAAFGLLGSADVVQAVRDAGDLVCGGVASVGNLVTYRHSIPLLNLNIDEFERPLHLVTSIADRLERNATVRSDRWSSESQSARWPSVNSTAALRREQHQDESDRGR